MELDLDKALVTYSYKDNLSEESKRMAVVSKLFNQELERIKLEESIEEIQREKYLDWLLSAIRKEREEL